MLVSELFAELKAAKGGDVGVQIDIFGNCFVHRSIPRYREFILFDKEPSNNSRIINTKYAPVDENEDNFICMHS
jgi:hypothetical protein